MKRVISVAVIMLFVAGMMVFGTQTLHAEMKIGSVDVEQVFNEYYMTKNNDEMLKKEGQAKADERRQMVEAIKKMKADSELLSETARTEKEAEIDAQIKNLQAFDQKTKAELRDKRDSFLKVIFDDLKVAIEKKGKEGGYTVILNDKALLYKAETLDITAEIIAEVNKDQASE